METNSASHSPIAGGVPGPEPRPIYLRAYAEAGRPNASAGNRVPDQPSPYVIVFDCETSTDPSQHLRFGSYQVRHDGRLREKGLFYDPDAVTDEELIQLQQHRPPGQALRTLRSFVEEIFFDIGYKADAVIVGFNLPFDISRLAIGHDTARRVTRNRRGERFTDQSMVGGFTFKLSTMPGRPNVRVKHLSRRAAFINFAAPDENPGGGGNVSRGFFLDLKTLAAALTSKSFSLDRLAVYLGVGRKRSFHDFNRPIDPEYMAYAAQDSETTRLCYEALMRQCAEHGLAKTEVTRIYSEASLGKAYLRSMGIKPWLAVETDGRRCIAAARSSAQLIATSPACTRRSAR